MTRSTRRTFLQSTAAAAAFGTFRGEIFGATSALEPSNPLGFGTYGLPGYSLEDAIDLVASVGFDSIELASMPGYHGDPDEIPTKDRGVVRKRIADSGITLGALMGLPTPDSAKAGENRDRVEKMLELARDLSPQSPPLIQSVLGGGEWEERKALFRDSLGPWVDLAREGGVQLAIKPHRGHAMSLPEHGVWLIEQLDAADYLKLVYDQSHFAFRDLKVEELVEQALPYTGYLVMKDAAMLDGKVRFHLPGEVGSVPHSEVLQQFLAGGYQGEICCEVSSHVWKAPGYDPAVATKTSYINLREIVTSSDESDYVSIFDGESLKDWDGKPGCWEVSDGEIWCTGEAQEKNWLIWRGGEPGDFVLRMDFRWDRGNSGVQVRSDDLGDWMVYGYQVEVAKQEVMGLWHHSLLAKDHVRREERHLMAEAGENVFIAKDGSKTMTPFQDADSVRASFREHEWNTLEVIARGDTLVQRINGVTFSSVTDRDTEMSRKKGLIALQDHGKGCQVAFRNIRIKHHG